MLTSSPIFVIGAPRSGTTLVQSLLAAHPALTSVPETSFFSRFIAQSDPALADPHHLVTKRHVAWLENDLADMVGMRPALAERWHASMTARELFIELVVALGADPTLTLVEKTTMHACFVPVILRYFPDARFVHVMRDPVAVVHSMSRIRPTSASDTRVSYVPDVFAACDQWTAAVSAAFETMPPDAGATVYYESLVQHPDATWADLAQTLGLSAYPDAVAEQHLAAQALLREAHTPWQARNLRPAFDATRAWAVDTQRSATFRSVVLKRTRPWSTRLGYDRAGTTGPSYQRATTTLMYQAIHSLSLPFREITLREKLLRGRDANRRPDSSGGESS